MNAQCSPAPYRLTVDGRLEKSGLYHQMKSFKTKPIEDIITSLMEKGVLPTIKDYNNIRGYAEDNADVSLENAFKRRILTAFLYAEADARTPYGATGYPVCTSVELKLESVLAALSTDETYSEDIRKDFESLGNALSLDIKHAFNPSIVNTATFDEMDYAYMARVLTAAYFKLKGLITIKDIEKQILWEELNLKDATARCCPYSGKQISAEMLFTDEVEIDHILPFSRTLDDS